jgi:magnesium transporter
MRRQPRQAIKAGAPPETMIHTGARKAERTTLKAICYDEAQFSERDVEVGDCAALKTACGVTWLKVVGLHEVETIQKIAEALGVHPLVTEDILDTQQRIKLELFEDYLFLVTRVFRVDEESGRVDAEQISVVMFENLVVTFQEGGIEIFEPVNMRLRTSRGRVRKMGADYLVYAVMDAVVDAYFVAVEELGERLEALEESVVTRPEPRSLQSLHDLRTEIAHIRKCVWPLREVMSSLERGESTLIGEATTIYLRDVYDHTIQLIDSIETYQEILSNLIDIYLSSVSYRLNEVMKLLTIIATVFIPLTFIVGLYGMNFKYFPELEWRWSYPLLWVVMLSIVGFMLLYFRRRKWL